jgi:hypothetical protein
MKTEIPLGHRLRGLWKSRCGSDFREGSPILQGGTPLGSLGIMAVSLYRRNLKMMLVELAAEKVVRLSH